MYILVLRSNSGLSYNSVEEEELTLSSGTSIEQVPEQVRVPLLGYEVMEERSRFTVSML